MHACLPSSAAYSAAWMKVMSERWYSWRRRWRGGMQFDDSALSGVVDDFLATWGMARL